jgi:hypothetical protein
MLGIHCVRLKTDTVAVQGIGGVAETNPFADFFPKPRREATEPERESS